MNILLLFRFGRRLTYIGKQKMYIIRAILNIKSTPKRTPKSTPKMTPKSTPNSTPKKTPDSTPSFTTCPNFISFSV
jgi:hypothetical protein